jgi:hypothetical protein
MQVGGENIQNLLVILVLEKKIQKIHKFKKTHFHGFLVGIEP